jgi:hypothetical protein
MVFTGAPMLVLAMMVVLGSTDWHTVNNKATGETSVSRVWGWRVTS